MLLTPIGVYNLSNTFAATLWSIDVVLNSALVGIDRFNFHGEPSGAYTTVVRALIDWPSPAAIPSVGPRV